MKDKEDKKENIKPIKLTDKQEMFCQEYLIDLNATQAAIRAGYSKKTAKDIACQNLSKVYLAERIAVLQKERFKSLKIDQEFVIKNLLLAMRISLGQEDTHVVGNVDGMMTSMTLKKTDVNNFIKIQEMLAKHIGFYELDNNQQSDSVTQNVVISDELAEKLNNDLEDEC